MGYRSGIDSDIASTNAHMALVAENKAIRLFTSFIERTGSSAWYSFLAWRDEEVEAFGNKRVLMDWNPRWRVGDNYSAYIPKVGGVISFVKQSVKASMCDSFLIHNYKVKSCVKNERCKYELVLELISDGSFRAVFDNKLDDFKIYTKDKFGIRRYFKERPKGVVFLIAYIFFVWIQSGIFTLDGIVREEQNGTLPLAITAIVLANAIFILSVIRALVDKD